MHWGTALARENFADPFAQFIDADGFGHPAIGPHALGDMRDICMS